MQEGTIEGSSRESIGNLDGCDSVEEFRCIPSSYGDDGSMRDGGGGREDGRRGGGGKGSSWLVEHDSS